MIKAIAFTTALLVVPIANSAELSFEQEWQLAEGFYKRQLFKDALKEFKKLLAKSNTSNKEDILLRISTCQENLNLFPEALQSIDLYIKNCSKESNRRLAKLRKATLLAKTQQHAEAISLLSSIGHSTSDQLWSSARYELCRIYMLQDKTELALKTIGNTLNSNQTSLIVRSYLIYTKAIIHTNKNQLTEATQAYAKFFRSPAARESQLLEQALFNSAAIHYQLADYSSAEALLDQLQKEFPQSSLNEEITLYQARIAYAQNKFLQVQTQLQQLALTNPEASFLVAQAAMNNENFSVAASHFRRAAHDPKFRESASYYEIICLDRLQDSHEILKILTPKLASTEAPNYADILYFYARASFRQKNYDTAAQNFLRAHKAGKKDWQYRLNCLQEMARTYEKVKKLKKAAEVWSQYANISTKDSQADALLRAAGLFQLAQEPQKSEKLYKTFLLKHPQHVESTNTGLYLLKLYQSSNRTDEAELFFNSLNEANLSLKNFALGMLSYEKAHYKKVVDFMEPLTQRKLTPALSSKVLTLLAFSHLQESNETKAAAYFNQIIKNKQAQLLSNQQILTISKLLRKQGYLESANHAALTILAQKESNIPEALNELALISLHKKKWIDAEKYAQKSINSENINDDTKSISLSIIAEATFERGLIADSWQAVEVANKIPKADKESSCRIFFIHAKLLLQQGETDKALRRLGQVYILHNEKPYTPRALSLAAEIYEKKQEYANSKKLIKELQLRFPFFYTNEKDNKQLKKNKHILK